MDEGSLTLRLEDIRRIDLELDAATRAGHPASLLKAGSVSPGGVAVAGREGVLFIGDGANRWEQQFLGQLTVTEAWRANWRQVLAARQAQARAHGVDLWNIVIPEKQVVLPHLRWPDAADPGAGRPLKLLLKDLPPDLRLLYPDAALAAAQALAPTFLRRNSHWTSWGCCKAAEILLQAMTVAAPLDDLILAARRQTFVHDLAGHFLDPAPAEETLMLAPLGEVTDDNRGLLPPGRHQGARYTLRNPQAPDPRTVILFGDSYAYEHGLAFVLGAAFARVTFIWSKSVVWDEVAALGADLVVWQSAERYLATLSLA